MRFQRLLYLLPLTFALTGCPVWGDGDPLGGPCDDDFDCPMATPACVLGECTIPCTRHDQCDFGEVCDRGGCFPGECANDSDCDAMDLGTVVECVNRQCVTNPCTVDADCDLLQRCESGACVPTGGCLDDGDCTVPGEVCDSRGACVPLPTGSCRTTADCTGGEVCVDGSCVDPGNEGCQFNYECPGGVCVNNACRPICPSCGSGNVCQGGVCVPTNECTSSSQCDTGEHCVGGRCLPGCTLPSQCTAPDTCINGFCRPDPAPRPFCTVATQATDCAIGSVCVDGACRVSCVTPATPSSECAMSDVSFVSCSAMNICLTANQVSPECLTVASCTGTELCIDGECRTP